VILEGWMQSASGQKSRRRRLMQKSRMEYNFLLDEAGKPHFL